LHYSVDDNSRLPRRYTVPIRKQMTIFWKSFVPPLSVSSSPNTYFASTYILKKEAANFSETSVPIYESIRRRIP